MKTNLHILLTLLLIAALGACVVHEPEIKPDYTKAGFQMYQNSENQIVKLSELFDVALMLDSFIKLPDASKAGFRTKYLHNYEILISDNSNYLLLERATSDTLYYFKTNAKSFQSVNSEWLVKGESIFENYIKVKCVDSNYWQISLKDSDKNWIQNADIKFVCTGKQAPASYFNSKFSLSGIGELTSIGDYQQKVKISYTITDSLKHEPETIRFKSGILNITAIDLETNQTETTSAEYIDANSSEWRVKIIYNGRTQVYQKYLYYGI
jgi:hypothetical protein